MAAVVVKKDRKKENVKVCVRIRPLNRLEERTSQKIAWSFTRNAITQAYFVEDEKTTMVSPSSKHKKAPPIQFNFGKESRGLSWQLVLLI